MGAIDVIWLFFLLTALQPILRQRWLESSRMRQLARIERARKSRVILLVHRQETMSLLGFPFFRYIDLNDSEEVLRAIHMTDEDVPLDLVLHTPGGLVLAAVQIADAIRRHPGRVTVFVPHYAMSGGTLIALAADEIVMSPHAALGPVDPQIGDSPAASLLRVLEQKPMAEIDDRTIVLADQARKALHQLDAFVRELLEPRLGAERAAEVAQLLTQGGWTHDHPILYRDALALGLAVREEMPPDVLRLMSLYPQPMRRRPSVEYLPGRRHEGGRE